MSFALTTKQILDRSKTVTRRTGWAFLKPGDLVQAIEKGQGLKKGEHVKKLAVIKVESLDREWLTDIVLRPDSLEEVAREGFPEMKPDAFVDLFAEANSVRAGEDVQVNRIHFSYVDAIGKDE